MRCLISLTHVFPLQMSAGTSGKKSSSLIKLIDTVACGNTNICSSEDAICSSEDAVNSISFSVDKGPGGQPSGNTNEIVLGDDDEVTKISGTRTRYGINSLAIETAQGVKYGPFGKSEGEEFSYSTENGDDPTDELEDSVYNFSSPSSEHSDSVPDPQEMMDEHTSASDEEKVVETHTYNTEKQHPNYGSMAWGHLTGAPYTPTMPSERITKISIGSGDVVDWLKFSYTFNGETRTAGPWGGSGGDSKEFVIEDDDKLIGISGLCGTYNGRNVIADLKFYTRKEKLHGPFGYYRSGQPFNFSIEEDHIVSFWAWTNFDYVCGISVQTAYDLHGLHGPYDELREERRAESQKSDGFSVKWVMGPTIPTSNVVTIHGTDGTIMLMYQQRFGREQS